LFDLLKNVVCIPCPINNNFELKLELDLHRSSRPQQLFIDPWTFSDPIRPLTIYRHLGWSNWPLGVDIDHFANHWPTPTRLVALQSFSNTHTGHVVLQSVQRFNEAVCRLQLNNTVTSIRG